MHMLSLTPFARKHPEKPLQFFSWPHELHFHIFFFFVIRARMSPTVSGLVGEAGASCPRSPGSAVMRPFLPRNVMLRFDPANRSVGFLDLVEFLSLSGSAICVCAPPVKLAPMVPRLQNIRA